MLIRTTCAIDENVYFLTVGDSCFYLLKGESSVHLLDVGASVHVDKLMARLAEIDVKPEQVSHVYLSNDNPARVAGIASFLSQATNARVYCSSELKTRWEDQSFLTTLAAENSAINDLYSNVNGKRSSAEDIAAIIPKIHSLPNTETISIASDLSLRAIATPGHSAYSMSFYIPELQFLITDQTYGYFRGKEPPAPGADFSIKTAKTSRDSITDLQVETLGFHSVGFVSGSLAQKHIQDIAEGSKALVAECKNASIAGVSEAGILESVKESVYTSAYRDPVLQWQMDRSLNAIWKQIVASLQ